MAQSQDVPTGLYLGFDLGTHALKAAALEVPAGGGALRTAHTVDVEFTRDLPAFAPPVRQDLVSGTADCDPRLFLAALDIAFARLRDAGCDMQSVVAISGSAQMHGSMRGRTCLEAAAAVSLRLSTLVSSLTCTTCFAFVCS